MKACVVQPHYSTDFTSAKEKFNWLINALDQIDESVDLVVLPEYMDVPTFTNSKEQFFKMSERFNKPLLDKVSSTAKRLNAAVFVNALSKENGLFRNTTYAFNKNGEVVCKYFKQHLTQNEMGNLGLDFEYTFLREPICTAVIDGVKYGFLTCYDFYFYEGYSRLALEDVDVVIGCCHQRTDTHLGLEIINKFCAYNVGAYLVRASVSMGKESSVGGGSCVICPDGTTLLDLKSDIGLGYAEFNPKEKYLKPAGYNNPKIKHGQYVEKGRRAVKYRNGAGIAVLDEYAPYPRKCLVGGISYLEQKNTLQSIALACSIKAQEIGVKLCAINEKIALKNIKDSQKHCLLEQVLEQFACKTVFNFELDGGFSDLDIDKTISLLREYDATKWAYFTVQDKSLLEYIKTNYPNIIVCVKQDNDQSAIALAKKYGYKKVLISNLENVQKAKSNNLIVSFAVKDKTQEEILKSGVDTLLIEDYKEI